MARSGTEVGGTERTNQGTVEPMARSAQEVEVKEGTNQGTVEVQKDEQLGPTEKSQPRIPEETPVMVIDPPHAMPCEMILDTSNLSVIDLSSQREFVPDEAVENVPPLQMQLRLPNLLCSSISPKFCSRRRHSGIDRRVQRVGIRVVAEQKTDLLRVLGTVWKVSKDGLDAGSKLVPDSVPRPVARAGVAIGGFVVISFLLKSLLSTTLFILGIVGLIYLVFIYINKDEGPRRKTKDGDPPIDETLEEARKIMDKYK